MSKKNRTLTEHEQSLWDHITKKIRPISSKQNRVRAQPPKPRLHQRNKTVTIPQEQPQIFNNKHIKISHRIERVRKVKIEARLDLHGLNLERARLQLIKFLISCQKNHYMWVLVITGKGKQKDDKDQPFHASRLKTLRDQVPQWLEEPALSTIVSAYTPAKPHDGGSGALYVRLKRIKPFLSHL